MRPNAAKSQIVHVRNHQQPRCDLDLYIDLREMAYVSDYKYLGCWINEFLIHTKTVDALTSAAGRSFGRIVNIFKRMGDMGYETYSTLCDFLCSPGGQLCGRGVGLRNLSSTPGTAEQNTALFSRGSLFCPIACDMD